MSTSNPSSLAEVIGRAIGTQINEAVKEWNEKTATQE